MYTSNGTLVNKKIVYTTRTKVFDHHKNLHTDSIKVDLLIKEYVLKL